jgi:hypothetical protein
MGGPMCRPCGFDTESCPSLEQLAQFMTTLLSRCSEIVGQQIPNATRPPRIYLKKTCRLLAVADFSVTPTCGNWGISPRTNQSGDSNKRHP